MFPKHQISLLESFMKDHVILMTGVTSAENHHLIIIDASPCKYDKAGFNRMDVFLLATCSIFMFCGFMSREWLIFIFVSVIFYICLKYLEIDTFFFYFLFYKNVIFNLEDLQI